MSEKTQYEGTGRNIFVSQAEEVVIPPQWRRQLTDAQQGYPGPPVIPPPPADSVEVLRLREFSGRAEKGVS